MNTNRYKALRLSKNYTQSLWAGTIVGVTEMTVRRWESGKGEPLVSQYEAMLAAAPMPKEQARAGPRIRDPSNVKRPASSRKKPDT